MTPTYQQFVASLSDKDKAILQDYMVNRSEWQICPSSGRPRNRAHHAPLFTNLEIYVVGAQGTRLMFCKAMVKPGVKKPFKIVETTQPGLFGIYDAEGQAALDIANPFGPANHTAPERLAEKLVQELNKRMQRKSAKRH